MDVTHPAPEIPLREATEAEVPGGARIKRKLAQANGWSVRAMYARGTRQHRTGKQGNVVDSMSLRMDRGNIYIAALWIDEKFDLAWRCPPGEFPTSGNSERLREWLVEPR